MQGVAEQTTRYKYENAKCSSMRNRAASKNVFTSLLADLNQTQPQLRLVRGGRRMQKH